MGFFKAYDMRGTFGADFDLDTVYRVGLCLPKVLGGRRYLVGRDCRLTGEKCCRALIAGLEKAGIEVVDAGLCTTPMVYFRTSEENFDASVMVTASHNPPGDNGLKVSKRESLPVGYSSGLDKVEKLVSQCSAHYDESAAKECRKTVDAERLGKYIAWMKHHTEEIKGVRYAVDCSNGMASIAAKELFPGAIIINDTPDGNFPCHSPNPLSKEAREQISALVREKKLDFGIIFDGDADRAMFVDERGEFIQPDYLVPVIADECVRAEDCAVKCNKVLHDVRTSRAVIESLKDKHFEPVMVAVGHANAKPVLSDLPGALCGGELAGHYYFKDFHCCDSGLLAALRIANAFGRGISDGKSVSGIMEPLIGKYANSGELNFKVASKSKSIEKALETIAKSFPKEESRVTIDGIRIEFECGWVNIRQSNTEPYLRLIVEAKTREQMEDWVAKLKEAILSC